MYGLLIKFIASDSGVFHTYWPYQLVKIIVI